MEAPMPNVYELDDDEVLEDLHVTLSGHDTSYDRVIARIISRLNDKKISLPQLLLVDDDEAFTRILSKIAQRENLPITVCNSVKEVAKLPRQDWKYDVG